MEITRPDAGSLSGYDEFVDDYWGLDSGTFDPAKHGGIPEIAYLAIAIAGEAGEISEKVKKAYREHGGRTDSAAIVKELGDLLYYVTKMAHLHGVAIEEVAQANVEKLFDRRSRGVLHGSGDER
jgi:NTP pyrophosphatase (non-canonical NTP hydrolase)